MRYLIFILLNLPIILLGLVNIITQYKLNRTTKLRLRQQLIMWTVLLTALIIALPLYNLIIGREAFNSEDLSLLDIIQSTAIVVLIYLINNQRQRIDQIEDRAKKLHQELSIKLSYKD